MKFYSGCRLILHFALNLSRELLSTDHTTTSKKFILVFHGSAVHFETMMHT